MNAARRPSRLPLALTLALALGAPGPVDAAEAPTAPGAPEPGPAFTLRPEVDGPVLGLGAAVAAARLVRTQPAWCAPRCDRDDLNAVDRTTAGFWSTGWQDASDIGLGAMAAGAVALLFVDEAPAAALTDALVIGETVLLAQAAASGIALAVERPRPFVYGDTAPRKERRSADAALSFVSSHSAVSFALATSAWLAVRRRHPDSVLPPLVLAVGAAAAGFVATARVMGGKHFPTDVAAGAVVGTSLGVLIPSLHEAPAALTPVAGTSPGLALHLRF